MPVDPPIQTLLELLESMNRPPMSAGTAEQARKAFDQLVLGFRRPEMVVPVAAVADHAIAGPDQQLPLRVYRPVEDDAGGRPTLVFFHGGGFVIGSIETHDNQCRTLCRALNAVVVSVGYRLAPETRWPGAVQDCLAATRWAAEHVGELGGDPTRLVVGGDSAGGNLAAVTAARCRDGGPALAAQLLVYPSVDLDEVADYPSRRVNAEGYFLTVDDMRWFAEQYVPEGAPREDATLSPLRNPDLAGLPPAVVVTGEYDPLRDEGQAYAAALAAAGVPVRHRCFAGLIHGFFDLGIMSAAAAAAVAETCRELSELLAGADEPAVEGANPARLV